MPVVQTVTDSQGFPDYFMGFQQPSSLYVSTNDVLRLIAASSQTSETVTAYVRQWKSDRTIREYTVSVSPANDRSVSTADLSMDEGFIVSIALKAAVAESRGQTFARLILTDTTVGLGNPTAMLCADYVTTLFSAGYPGGRVLSPVEGPGQLLEVQVTAPGAGNQWAWNVPTNARWKLRGWTANFYTSALVANRYPRAVISSGGLGIYVSACPAAVPANKVVSYAAGSAAPAVNADPGAQQFVLPDGVVLHYGDGLAVVVLNMDTADAWSDAYIHVEEWIDLT